MACTVIYARCIVCIVFLQVAQDIFGSLATLNGSELFDLHHLWLVAQVRPVMVFGEDIFLRLCKKIRHFTDADFLSQKTDEKFREILVLIGHGLTLHRGRAPPPPEAENIPGAESQASERASDEGDEDYQPSPDASSEEISDEDRGDDETKSTGGDFDLEGEMLNTKSFLIIVDEVQELTMTHSGSFMSDANLKNEQVWRPMLREIIVSITSTCPLARQVLSGTSFDEDVVTEAVGSVVGKVNAQFGLIHSLGRHHEELQMQKFCKLYLGTATPTGALWKDIFFWFTGRFVADPVANPTLTTKQASVPRIADRIHASSWPGKAERCHDEHHIRLVRS